MAEREQSDFNMAVSYLNRLNTLLLSCDDSALRLDAYNWVHCLSALHRELSTRMKNQAEIDQYNARLRALATTIDMQTRANDRKGTSRVPMNTYMELHTLEIDLRKVMKEAGLETRMINEEAKQLR